MTTIAVQVRCGLIALILFAGSSVAAERDSKADVVMVSARFVEMYARTPHKAGDPDGQFIEDVVVPAVSDVVTGGGTRLTDAQYQAVLDFIVASDSLASEEISNIAVNLYVPQKIRLCASVAKLRQSKRTVVLDRIKSGLAATGKPVPRTVCK